MKKTAIFIILFTIMNYAFVNAQTKGNNMEEKKESTQDSLQVALISTDHGDIEIQLYTQDAPKTTKNFIELAKKNYFDGVLFHRIAKDFVIQGGDPTGTGSGGTSIYGETFEDELNPNTESYKEGYTRGTVAMANRGPNTNSSQFFICLNDVHRLPKNYTIFGKVIKGMEVVDEIAAQPIRPQMGSSDGRPVNDIKMKTVKIETRPGNFNSVFDVK